MKHSRSVKKGSTCVQTSLKKKKMVNASLTTGVGTDDKYMQEEDIVTESKPAASPTLSEMRRSALRKLFKAMNLLWFMYDVHFRH